MIKELLSKVGIGNDEEDTSEEESDEETLALIRKRYDEGVKGNQDFYNEAELCWNFFNGNQYPDATQSGDGGAKDWRVRLVLNKILPSVEASIAPYITKKPRIIAEPGSNTDSDINSAKVSEKVIRYYWDKSDFFMDMIMALFWAKVTGNCFARPRWDPKGGDKVTLPQQEQVPGEVQQAQPQTAHEGCLDFDILSPFSCVCDPGAAVFEDCAWFQVTDLLKSDDVASDYNLKLSEVDQYVRKIESTNTFDPRIMLTRDLKLSGRTLVYTYYERPTKKYKNGRLIKATHDKILSRAELPNGEIRVVQFSECLIPGLLFATSKTAQSIPLQTEFNKAHSQIIEDNRLMGRPKWTAPTGALTVDNIDQTPGQVVEWDLVAARGMKPTMEHGVPVSQSRFQFVQMIKDEISDAMSRHSVSFGSNSPNVTSNVQAETYQNADNARDSLFVFMFERQLSKLWTYALRELSENITGEMIGSIKGDYDRREIFSFTNVDISSPKNVKLDMSSDIEWKRSNSRQTLLWMYSQKIITKEQLQEQLNFPVAESIYEINQTERRNARKENELLMSGIEFPPSETDDHESHINEHKYEINLPENRVNMMTYFSQNQVWPPGVTAIKKHMALHQQAMPKPVPDTPDTKINLRGDLSPNTAQELAGVAVPGPAQPSGNSPEGLTQSGMATPPGDNASGMSGEMTSSDQQQMQ